MSYRLLTLGRVGVEDAEGNPVAFPIGKPFGILVYLALSGAPVARDELAELFWSDAPRSRARHSVRQALSYIRKHLGEELFRTDDPVALDGERVTTDVDDLRVALAEGDPEAALARYPGPFLGGVQLASSPQWDHWVESRRRVLVERVGALLRQAARSESDAERAVRCLERAVEIEPHRVGHRELLVERLLERGDVERAQGMLAEARQADLDDPERLAAVAERIERFVAHRDARYEPEALTPEFVGRSKELAKLSEAWKRVRGGRREIAVLSGPTGIGKTRLAQELARLAEAGGGQAVQVKAAAAERRLEWGVTAELVRALHGMPGAAGISGGTESVLRSLVPSLGAPTAAPPPPSVRPVAISDALADLIEAVAYEGPLLIVLDDMQWVDRTSVSLLLRTARQVRQEPVMVVFTFRSEEVSTRGLLATQSLIREEGAFQLALKPLTRPEVEELLSLSGLEESDRFTALAERLYDVSRGHPLFLVELLRSLQDEGVLRREGNGWRLEGPAPAQLQLPPSVQRVMAKRVERLSDEARRVGQALARLPRGIGIDRVRLRTGLSDADFTEGLNELLARDVARWDAAGRLVFTHDQLREALVSPGSRNRRWWAAAVAAAVVLAAGIWGLATESEPLYGGGTLVVQLGDSAYVLEPTGRGGDGWARRSLDLWKPRDPSRYAVPRPRRLADGSLVWFGTVQTLHSAPDIALYRRGAGREVLVERPGDDLIGDISPDGRSLAYFTENAAKPGYVVDFRLRPIRGDTGRILARGGATGAAFWAPDGRRIAASLSFARDSLYVFTPAGQRVATYGAFLIRPETWCGGSRFLVLRRRREPTEPLERVLVDLEQETERILDPRAAAPDSRCSPDGSALVSASVERGRVQWYLQGLARGDRSPIPDSLISASPWIEWVPPSLPPVPVRLQLDADSLTLAQGDRRKLTARLRLSDGSVRPARVHLRSRDPGIVSVLTADVVAANRAGETRVVATHDRWLADTVQVHVRPGESPTLLLSDDFRQIASDWVLLGQPEPTAVSVDGEPALELRGDGRYADGIVYATGQPVPTGTTLELEFRHPQTRPDRQTFGACLVDTTPPADSARLAVLTAWTRGRRLCFRYPAYELQKWSPELAQFGFEPGEIQTHPVPADVKTGAWTHLAIQVLPDGTASLWLDREKVATVIGPAEFLTREGLRPLVIAGTVDIRTFIRDLAWWAEPRFQ